MPTNRRDGKPRRSKKKRGQHGVSWPLLVIAALSVVARIVYKISLGDTTDYVSQLWELGSMYDALATIGTTSAAVSASHYNQSSSSFLAPLKSSNHRVEKIGINQQQQQQQQRDLPQCTWAVLAGDSNTRNLFHNLDKVVQENYQTQLANLKKTNPGAVHKAATLHVETVPRIYSHNGTVVDPQIHIQEKGKRCGFMWADAERIYLILKKPTNKNNGNGDTTAPPQQREIVACHIVTLKFLQSQTASRRLVKNLHNSNYCGTELQDMKIFLQHSGYQRPLHPQFLYYSHGLWELPNEGGQHARGLDCRERFANLIPDLQQFQSTWQSQVVWASNFEFNNHPTIRAEYLQWELQCQKQLAQAHNISMIDVAATLTPLLGNRRMVNHQDWHLTPWALQAFTEVILKRYFPYFTRKQQGSGTPRSNTALVDRRHDRRTKLQHFVKHQRQR